MSTRPPDQNPDSPPLEAPPQRPDEIRPGGGDIDQPDVVPPENPGTPVAPPTPDGGQNPAARM